MSVLSRRQLLRYGGLSLFSIVLLPLTACQTFEAKPFVIGKEVSAPLGCQEMRARDERADC